MEKDGKDVQLIDDAILYIQNIIAAENHALESWYETKDEKWLKIAQKLRRNRSIRLYKIVPEDESEVYCFSKHILVCAVALKELFNRYTEDNEEKLAKECLEEASLYERLFKLLVGGNK